EHIGSPSRLTVELRLLLTAVQYFTRLPMPSWVGHSAEQLRGSARYFSLVGILVGGVGAFALWATSSIFPTPLPAILSTAITIFLTGAFHEDGLADTFDGLGGGATRERALEIMKDPRVGTFGMAALLMTLLIKIAALNSISTELAVIVLVAGHAFSRTCAISLLYVGNYVGNTEQSRAGVVAQKMSGGEFAVAATIGVIPLLWCGQQGIVGAICALLVLLVLARWFIRRLGGFTGDTLGAAQQLTEIAFYLGIGASWNFI
ncbi:MAG: adenosylcobinamide-GDP ribazoletransferase, partial [Steroidobacter sp.]